MLAACRNAAHAKGIWVHLGSLAVRTDEQKLANRTFVIDPTGKLAYMVDDQTVAKTDGGGTRSILGRVVRVEPLGGLKAFLERG